MTKRMSQFKAWRHLAAAFGKPVKDGIDTYAAESPKFDQTPFLCIALLDLCANGFITENTRATMKEKIMTEVRAVSKPGFNTMALADRDGMRVRELFCRRMMKEGGCK